MKNTLEEFPTLKTLATIAALELFFRNRSALKYKLNLDCQEEVEKQSFNFDFLLLLAKKNKNDSELAKAIFSRELEFEEVLKKSENIKLLPEVYRREIIERALIITKHRSLILALAKNNIEIADTIFSNSECYALLADKHSPTTIASLIEKGQEVDLKKKTGEYLLEIFQAHKTIELAVKILNDKDLRPRFSSANLRAIEATLFNQPISQIISKILSKKFSNTLGADCFFTQQAYPLEQDSSFAKTSILLIISQGQNLLPQVKDKIQSAEFQSRIKPEMTANEIIKLAEEEFSEEKHNPAKTVWYHRK